MFARIVAVVGLAGCFWACATAPAPLVFWPSLVAFGGASIWVIVRDTWLCA